MTDIDLTSVAAHSRDAMLAIDHIAREGGTGGMTYIMTSAEDVPGLLKHIAGLQRVVDDQKERLLAQANVIGLMRPVVEYVSRGRTAVDVGPYPDATARRALGALAEVQQITARVEELKRNEASAIDDAIRNEEWADRLAAATAAHFGVDIGEHSNVNDPWANALAAFGSTVDKAFADSPQVREWLANTKEPVGPGKPDDLAELEAERDAVIARLEEASAVIVLAGQQVSLDSRAWVTLDGYDGSGDACRELEAKGYTRSGNGGWYPPKDGA